MCGAYVDPSYENFSKAYDFSYDRLLLRPSLKVLITCLLLVLEVCNVKPTYRKSWAGNRLIGQI